MKLGNGVPSVQKLGLRGTGGDDVEECAFAGAYERKVLRVASLDILTTYSYGHVRVPILKDW